MKDKPLAVVGINSNRHTPGSLKTVMLTEALNWRTFADDGTILQKWNAPPTPTFYVIDHMGIIQHKWIGHPGETTIDNVLDKLIRDVK